MLGWLRAHTSLIVVGGALLVGAAVAAAVFVPLVTSSGQVSAELAGSLPAQAVVGHHFEIDVSFDNTGTSVVSPVCVGISAPATLQPLTAVFQGVDHVAFSNNRVCGGALGAGETISIRLMLTAASAGALQYQLIPQQGTRVIGPPLSGSLAVASA